MCATGDVLERQYDGPMTDVNRERRLITALTTLADTLVADYDIVDLMQTLVEKCDGLLGARSTGLLLANPSGDLEMIATSNSACRNAERAQVHSGSGPCLDSFATHEPVAVTDIGAAGRWDEFRAIALADGLLSIHAFPLTLRGMTIGVMSVYRDAIGGLDDSDVSVAAALADMATIGILQERSIREKDHVNRQLQSALKSRVVIEQAKGILAQSGNVDADQAFSAMRQYARANNLPLHKVAARVAERSINIWPAVETREH